MLRISNTPQKVIEPSRFLPEGPLKFLTNFSKTHPKHFFLLNISFKKRVIIAFEVPRNVLKIHSKAHHNFPKISAQFSEVYQ